MSTLFQLTVLPLNKIRARLVTFFHNRVWQLWQDGFKIELSEPTYHDSIKKIRIKSYLGNTHTSGCPSDDISCTLGLSGSHNFLNLIVEGMVSLQFVFAFWYRQCKVWQLLTDCFIYGKSEVNQLLRVLILYCKAAWKVGFSRLTANDAIRRSC